MIGEIVGNFEIVSRLGKGGGGEVWLAEQQSVKTRVAIKLLAADVSSDTRQVKRFFNEAVAVAKIRHSGIVKIFDVGFHASGRAYLAMELLEGETLGKRIRRAGRLPIAQLAEIARQIASVLDACHAAGITHRDLKPDNIFLVRDPEHATGERVKLLDFGIAKLGNLGLTSTGAGVMGTPLYMSPEQWRDASKVDARTDAYSLGCVAFEMACGRPPFLATTMGDACGQHMTEPPPAPRSLVAALPESFDLLVARLLEKDPALRPAMKDVVAAFATLARGHAVALEETVPQPARDPVLLDQRPHGETVTSIQGVDAVSRTTLSSAAGTRPGGRRGRNGLVWAIGGGAVATVTVAIVVAARSNDPAPEPATDAAVAAGIPADAPVIASKPATPAPRPAPAPAPKPKPQPGPKPPPVAAPIVVSIQSTPKGAEVWLEGKQACTATPCPIAIKDRRGTHTLEVRHAGYVSKRVEVDAARHDGRTIDVTLDLIPDPDAHPISPGPESGAPIAPGVDWIKPDRRPRPHDFVTGKRIDEIERTRTGAMPKVPVGFAIRVCFDNATGTTVHVGIQENIDPAVARAAGAAVLQWRHVPGVARKGERYVCYPQTLRKNR